MYRILICDDRPDQLEEVSAQVSDILQELNIGGIPECFDCPATLMKAVCSVKNDHILVLMDILLGEQNGVDITAGLHEFNQDISVVLMSTSADYILRGYDVQAIQYLLKPIEREKLKRTIFRDYDEAYLNSRIRVLQRNVITSIICKDITYLECVNGVTEIHTKDSVVMTAEPYGEVTGRLPKGKFGKCRRSIYVNLQWVREVAASQVTLTNGMALPIGRMYYRQFRADFMTYIHNSLN